MATITGKYLGDLKVESTHSASGATLTTEAPLDNGGKGEMFSPTDLCVTSLGACAMTIMGRSAQTHGLDISGATFSINKIMSPKPPRRIARIELVFTMPDREYSDKDKKSLERAAESCPVHLSLHPETEQAITFKWAK